MRRKKEKRVLSRAPLRTNRSKNPAKYKGLNHIIKTSKTKLL